MTLAVHKMDGHGHINTARRECLPKKTKVMRYELQEDYRKDVALYLIIKVSGQMRSDTFKRRSLFGIFHQPPHLIFLLTFFTIINNFLATLNFYEIFISAYTFIFLTYISLCNFSHCFTKF